jgi:hypothetical protein
VARIYFLASLFSLLLEPEHCQSFVLACVLFFFLLVHLSDSFYQVRHFNGIFTIHSELLGLYLVLVVVQQTEHCIVRVPQLLKAFDGFKLLLIHVSLLIFGDKRNILSTISFVEVSIDQTIIIKILLVLKDIKHIVSWSTFYLLVSRLGFAGSQALHLLIVKKTDAILLLIVKLSGIPLLLEVTRQRFEEIRKLFVYYLITNIHALVADRRAAVLFHSNAAALVDELIKEGPAKPEADHDQGKVSVVKSVHEDKWVLRISRLVEVDSLSSHSFKDCGVAYCPIAKNKHQDRSQL